MSSLWFLWAACGFTRGGCTGRTIAMAKPSPERCKALWVLSCVQRAGRPRGRGQVRPGMRGRPCSSATTARSSATKMLGTAALLQDDLPQAQAYLGVAIEPYQGGRMLNPGLLWRSSSRPWSSTTRAPTPGRGPAQRL